MSSPQTEANSDCNYEATLYRVASEHPFQFTCFFFVIRFPTPAYEAKVDFPADIVSMQGQRGQLRRRHCSVYLGPLDEGLIHLLTCECNHHTPRSPSLTAALLDWHARSTQQVCQEFYRTSAGFQDGFQPPEARSLVLSRGAKEPVVHVAKFRMPP